ncbi:hypothetical protein LCGC14_1377860 [marine sediment metagenome]|uniref:Uncharacterized protein n=1 Tax=marine sediment metagenome TaxID=412755 RepID=A0A0F9N5A3_9ZZZZ
MAKHTIKTNVRRPYYEVIDGLGRLKDAIADDPVMRADDMLRVRLRSARIAADELGAHLTYHHARRRNRRKNLSMAKYKKEMTMPQDSYNLAESLAVSWVNGNRDVVIEKLASLSGIVAAAVSVRIVLILLPEHEVPLDLAHFTSRLECEAHKN